jgi:hypothetical protein
MDKLLIGAVQLLPATVPSPLFPPRSPTAQQVVVARFMHSTAHSPLFPPPSLIARQVVVARFGLKVT